MAVVTSASGSGVSAAVPPPISKRTSSKELIAPTGAAVLSPLAQTSVVLSPTSTASGGASAAISSADSKQAAAAAPPGASCKNSNIGSRSPAPSRRNSQKFAPRPSRVVKPFTASNPGEMSLAVGEAVTVVSQVAGGKGKGGGVEVLAAWVVGIKPQGQGKGKFPASCVTPMKRATKM